MTADEMKFFSGLYMRPVNAASLSVFCLSPVKTGPCRAAFPRWFYSAANGSCQLFTFGGCNPNQNNYLSIEDCTAACRGVTGNTHLPGRTRRGSSAEPEP